MHKNLCKSFLLVATVLLVVTGCGGKTQKVQEMKQPKQTAKQETTEITDEKTVDTKEKLAITSDVQELKIEVGETKPLSYTVTGGDADTVLDFQSGDPNKISTDQDGNITGVEEGTAYVVAKNGDAECYWNVTIIPAASISSNVNENIEMYVGDSQSISYIVDGGDKNYVPIVTKGNESMVTVSESESSDNKNFFLEIAAVGVGNTTITVQYGNIAKRVWNITVKPQEDSLPDGDYGVDIQNVEADGNYLIIRFPENDWDGSENSYNGKTFRIEVSEDGEFLNSGGVNEEGELRIFHFTFDEWTRSLGPGTEFTVKDNKIIKIWGAS